MRQGLDQTLNGPEVFGKVAKCFCGGKAHEPRLVLQAGKQAGQLR